MREVKIGKRDTVFRDQDRQYLLQFTFILPTREFRYGSRMGQQCKYFTRHLCIREAQIDNILKKRQKCHR